MAKGTYRGIIGPNDPIWEEGWIISTHNVKQEKPKTKPKLRQAPQSEKDRSQKIS